MNKFNLLVKSSAIVFGVFLFLVIPTHFSLAADMPKPVGK